MDDAYAILNYIFRTRHDMYIGDVKIEGGNVAFIEVSGFGMGYLTRHDFFYGTSDETPIAKYLQNIYANPKDFNVVIKWSNVNDITVRGEHLLELFRSENVSVVAVDDRHLELIEEIIEWDAHRKTRPPLITFRELVIEYAGGEIVFPGG